MTAHNSRDCKDREIQILLALLEEITQARHVDDVICAAGAARQDLLGEEG